MTTYDQFIAGKLTSRPATGFDAGAMNPALTGPADKLFLPRPKPSPFAGIGSEGYCAVKHKRKFIGSELKRSYWDAAKDHLTRAAAEREDLFSLAGVAV